MEVDNKKVDMLVKLILKKRDILNSEPIVLTDVDVLNKIGAENNDMMSILNTERELEEELGEKLFHLYVGYAMSIITEEYEVTEQIKKRINNFDIE